AGSGSYSVAGFSTASLSAASITLSASGGNFVSIGAQPQNKLRFEFTAPPVPEPSVYALLLAGLGVLGLRSRRRQQA
ncbi:PEP-CTERM sorting domain-containing protein, partial [Klebsiella pneumoniae]|uniref:PEP-CTERM sorting domain-containing protein n=1 Tax=Klebsiella pneumoniae TaxID=573 RepID=UPI0027304983